MASTALQRITALAVLVLPACASRSGPPPPEPEVIEAEKGEARRDPDRRGPLGIPEGHLPPVGECRVWYPGRPPGQQPAPSGCAEAERNAPPGTWILYRPPEDQRVVHARVLDPARRGMVIRIELFDAERGTYLGTMETEQPAP